MIEKTVKLDRILKPYFKLTSFINNNFLLRGDVDSQVKFSGLGELQVRIYLYNRLIAYSI